MLGFWERYIKLRKNRLNNRLLEVSFRDPVQFIINGRLSPCSFFGLLVPEFPGGVYTDPASIEEYIAIDDHSTIIAGIIIGAPAVEQVAAGYLKQQKITVRVNTDGQANLVHGRNILPELAGLVDVISVSLNAPDASTYQEICRSEYGEQGYVALKEFLDEARKHIPSVTATAFRLSKIDCTAGKSARRTRDADPPGSTHAIRPFDAAGRSFATRSLLS